MGSVNVKKERYLFCQFPTGIPSFDIVTQIAYLSDTSGRPIWGCKEPCPLVICQYNLNPENEAQRRIEFGRTCMY